MGRRVRRQNGRGVISSMQNLLSTVGVIENPPMYEGEKHLKGYNFLGPHTNLDERRKNPVDFQPTKKHGKIGVALDSAAKSHDLKFESLNKRLKSGEINTKEAMEQIHDADDDFIEDLKNIKGLSLTKEIASKAILLKKIGEKAGFIPPSQFSLSGSGFFPPDHKLRKQKMQNGGFPPILIGLAGSVLAGLASTALNRVIDHFTGSKQKGGALKKKTLQQAELRNITATSPIEDRRKFAMHLFDNMNPEEQIDGLHKILIEDAKV